MNTWFSHRGAMIVVSAAFAMTIPALAEDRPADKLLAKINAVEMPKPPGNRNDQQAVQDFLVDRAQALDRRAKLILELYKAYPDTPELAQLMPERWQSLILAGSKPEPTQAEIASVIAKTRNPKLKNEAAFIQIALAYQKLSRSGKMDEFMVLFNEFQKQFPADERGAQVLFTLAGAAKDETRKDQLMKRLEKEYADVPAVKGLVGKRRQTDGVGKPFELEFTEAIKGSPISIASLKGKVVVIDFWATWCGPCVAEMPNMKKLYAEYKDQGVEFIGVSLDAPREEGGLDKLKDFVIKNKIEWPQYYEGKIPATDFATSWGIEAIPSLFLIDADGNLVSTQARGELETLIPKFLKKAKAGKSGSSL